MDVEAIVLGAGYAGLSAAETLRLDGKEVLIIEARDRVGGRTRTDHFDQEIELDLGGQWVGPGQDSLYALARRLGHSVWSMHTDGASVLHIGGRRSLYRGLIPRTLSPLALANLAWGFARLDWMAKKIPLEDPRKAKKAAALDRRSVGDWLRRNLPHRQARQVMEIAIMAVFAAHPDDISLLHALFYLHSGGGLENLTSSSGGAQQDRIKGGMQGLASSWASRLEATGVHIQLEAPAWAIEQDQRGVAVHTDQGVFHSKHLISTLPPGLAADLDFRPGMPPDRQAWCSGILPGQVIKCFAVYDRPFWREEGLSGQAVGAAAPIHVAFDATPPGTKKGVLLGFFEGREARRWSDAPVEDRKEIVLQAFSRFFGKEALSPRKYVDHVWIHEKWSSGCYAGVAAPGLLTSLNSKIHTPWNRIFWAGTETATHWNGYIEGAIRSGVRAAKEVAQH